MKGKYYVFFLAGLLFTSFGCMDFDDPGQMTAVDVEVRDYFSDYPIDEAAFVIRKTTGADFIYSGYTAVLDTVRSDSEGKLTYQFINEEDSYYRIWYVFEGEYYPLDYGARLIKEGESNHFTYSLKEVIPVEMEVSINPDENYNSVSIEMENDREHVFCRYYITIGDLPVDTTFNFLALRDEKGTIDIKYHKDGGYVDLNQMSFQIGMIDSLFLSLEL